MAKVPINENSAIGKWIEINIGLSNCFKVAQKFINSIFFFA
tara:strand:- start:114848 stop:114970 length:123 start_codon:yes stop_codon:yes gene_type:complete